MPLHSFVDESKQPDYLEKLIEDQTERDVRRLVLERDDSLVDFDRRFIRAQLLKTTDPERMSYDHLRAYEEPLLSVPDAIAWCWAHGGIWRNKISPLIHAIHEL